MTDFYLYLLVCATVTYAVRALPFVLVKNKIENIFLVSFLHYVPYAVLAVMTVPAVFYATSSTLSAVIGFLIAFLFAYFEKSLILVALAGCCSAFLTELIMKFV